MRRLLFNNANQINTIIIGFNDGDMQWPYINHIAHTGNVTICRDHEARDRRDIIVIGKVLNIKRLLQGMQICTAFYQPAVTVGNEVETGREGVKALKAKPIEKAAPAPAVAAPKVAPTPAKPMGPNDYMVIGLARIDDRLIHGQVATRWTKETNVSRIIVVSDEVAADTVRKTLLTQVAPPGVTAHVVDVAKMIRVYNNPKYAGERVMLLFTNPTDVERLVEGGVKITSVNVGGMAFRQGKTQVNNAVSVDEKDIEAFKKLNARGIELEVRKVSTDPKLKMMDLISKIDK